MFLEYIMTQRCDKACRKDLSKSIRPVSTSFLTPALNFTANECPSPFFNNGEGRYFALLLNDGVRIKCRQMHGQSIRFAPAARV